MDRRLVEIARALATDPRVLLLDEPAAGLSREDKERLAVLLRRIADAGIGVLLVEHDMELVMGISHHVVVLDAGQHLAAGTPAQVQADPRCARPILAKQWLPQATRARRGEGREEMLGVGRCSPATAPSPCCVASTCRCGAAKWSRCWGPTARASRR